MHSKVKSQDGITVLLDSQTNFLSFGHFFAIGPIYKSNLFTKSAAHNAQIRLLLSSDDF